MEQLQTQPTDDIRLKLQNFITILSKQPKESDLAKTPDGKAYYLPVDFVETTLDELFFGLWQTTNYRWQVLQNEVIGVIMLKVFHPVANTWIEREGCASYTIMMDALSQSMKDTMTPQERNMYSLNIMNKKPNALDMGFPKLKADCIKNACLSLGNIFGRNINRVKKDTYTPIIKPIISEIKAQLTNGETAK